MPTTEGYNGAYTGQQIDSAIAKAQKAITVNAGGDVSMGPTIGAGPYTIEMTEEEIGDLTATQVSYNNAATGMAATNVQDAVTELFTSVSEGKALIAAAVTDKGVETAADATFQQMAENISKIKAGDSLEKVTVSFEYEIGDILAYGTGTDGSLKEYNSESFIFETYKGSLLFFRTGAGTSSSTLRRLNGARLLFTSYDGRSYDYVLYVAE